MNVRSPREDSATCERAYSRPAAFFEGWCWSEWLGLVRKNDGTLVLYIEWISPARGDLQEKRGTMRCRDSDYKGTSPIKKRSPLGPYSIPMPRDLW